MTERDDQWQEAKAAAAAFTAADNACSAVESEFDDVSRRLDQARHERTLRREALLSAVKRSGDSVKQG